MVHAAYVLLEILLRRKTVGVMRKRVLFAGSDRVDETDSVLVRILLLFASRSQKRGVFFLPIVYPCILPMNPKQSMDNQTIKYISNKIAYVKP